MDKSSRFRSSRGWKYFVYGKLTKLKKREITEYTNTYKEENGRENNE